MEKGSDATAIDRVCLGVMTSGYEFGRVDRFDGAAANRIRIGRARTAEMHLRGDWSLEPIHCTIHRQDGGHVLVNHSVCLPVQLNGHPVRGSLRMKSGDWVRAGSTTLMYHREIIPDSAGNDREPPEEGGLGALYAGLKRVCGRLGLLGR